MEKLTFNIKYTLQILSSGILDKLKLLIWPLQASVLFELKQHTNKRYIFDSNFVAIIWTILTGIVGGLL